MSGPPRILITRPVDAARALAARLSSLGYAPLIEPLLTILPTRAPCPGLTNIDAVLLTSANALAALHEIDTALLALPCYCVGAQTAAAAKDYGFKDVRHSNEPGSGDELARFILEEISLNKHHTGSPPLEGGVRGGGATQSLSKSSDRNLIAKRAPPPPHLPLKGGGVLPVQPQKILRLLHIAGEHTDPTMRQRLTAAGHTVELWPVYTAQPAAALSPATIAALQDDKLDAVLVYSTRTAEILAARLMDHGLKACCARLTAIGLSAAVLTPLRPLPWQALAAAPEPTEDAVIALLQSRLPA